MNGKFAAKQFTGRSGPVLTGLVLSGLLLVGLVLTGWLFPLSVTADVGNLNQQLRMQQQKSRFQLMLEQVQESARRRAAAAANSATQARPSNATGLGDWTQSLRLDLVNVTKSASSGSAPASTARLQAEQTYARDQRRILDHRQQRRALIAGTRVGGSAALDGFAAKRRELVRYRQQNNQQSLQRKLR